MDIDPGIDATVRLFGSSAAIIPEVAAYFVGRHVEHPIETYARELLGIDPPLTTAAGYRSDSVHPLFSELGTIHPDNGDSLAYAARPGVQRARELRALESDSDVQVILSSDMLLFGSPASEGLSRVVFGYSLTNEGLYLPFQEELFPVAYRWELDEEATRQRVVRRYVRGRAGAPARPAWRIRNVDGNGEAPFYQPTVYGGGPLAGFLEDDFLLVTKLPNFLTPAYSDGRFIVSFGGAHGVGTRAVALLLRSEPALRDIARRLPPSEGRLPSSYQILLRIHPIVHDPQRGSYGTGVHCIDAVRLQDREQQPTWEAAMDAVAPRLRAWRGVGT